MYTALIETGDIRTWVQTVGQGESIIFIHGALLNSHLWRRQLNELSRGFHCIAYDLRGHGRTGPSSVRRYSTEVFADDLLAIYRALGIEKATLCGLSLGGMIAQNFASRFPDRVHRLILCDTGVSTRYFLSDKLFNSAVGATTPALISFLGVPRFRLFTQQLNRRIGHTHWVSKSGEGLKFAHEAMEMIGPREMIKIFDAVLGFNGTRLHRPAVPVLIMNGQHDSPLILRQGKILQRLYRGAEYELIPVASHLSNLDNPIYFHLVIERFLRGSWQTIRVVAAPSKTPRRLALGAAKRHSRSGTDGSSDSSELQDAG
jgi:3-oxoadipate enol-lactonase